MCLECRGRGYTSHISEDLIIPDGSKNIIEITKAGSAVFADQLKLVQQLPDFYDFDINTPFRDLPEDIKKMFLYGSGKTLEFKWESKRFSGKLEYEYEGIIPHIKRALAESKSAYRKNKINNYMIKAKCGKIVKDIG